MMPPPVTSCFQTRSVGAGESEGDEDALFRKGDAAAIDVQAHKSIRIDGRLALWTGELSQAGLHTLQAAAVAQQAFEVVFQLGDASTRVRELARQTDGARSSRFQLVELAVNSDVRFAELRLQVVNDLL